MNAETLTRALGGRWRGTDGEARCPAHEDKTPSLSIRDGDNGRLLTCCHAGCAPEAVLGALQDRGLVERGGDRAAPRRRRAAPQRAPGPSPNQDHALEIWRASRNPIGTLTGSYQNTPATPVATREKSGRFGRPVPAPFAGAAL